MGTTALQSMALCLLIPEESRMHLKGMHQYSSRHFKINQIDYMRLNMRTTFPACIQLCFCFRQINMVTQRNSGCNFIPAIVCACTLSGLNHGNDKKAGAKLYRHIFRCSKWKTCAQLSDPAAKCLHFPLWTHSREGKSMFPCHQVQIHTIKYTEIK